MGVKSVATTVPVVLCRRGTLLTHDRSHAPSNAPSNTEDQTPASIQIVSTLEKLFIGRGSSVGKGMSSTSSVLWYDGGRSSSSGVSSLDCEGLRSRTMKINEWEG
jgi:hypothetical protein